MGVPCPRCLGCGQVDTIQKVVIHPDNKHCTYWQDREVCAYCEGKCFMDQERIPALLRKK